MLIFIKTLQKYTSLVIYSSILFQACPENGSLYFTPHDRVGVLEKFFWLKKKSQGCWLLWIPLQISAWNFSYLIFQFNTCNIF